MTWASLLLTLVKLVGSFASYLHDQQLISAGEAEASAAALRGQADALDRAREARESVRSDLARHPDRVRQDDGFRRE